MSRHRDVWTGTESPKISDFFSGEGFPRLGVAREHGTRYNSHVWSRSSIAQLLCHAVRTLDSVPWAD